MHSFVDGFSDGGTRWFLDTKRLYLYSLRQILKMGLSKYLPKTPPFNPSSAVDVNSLENLRKEVYHNFSSRISFLSENFKIRDIGKHVCISHHGSVTEEAYLVATLL